MPDTMPVRTKSAFNAALMERFWILESDFLAGVGQVPPGLDARRNQLLLSAVLFGGLLNPADWPRWLRTLMGKVRNLPAGGRLDPDETRAVYIAASEGAKGRIWFADPVTGTLLGQPLLATVGGTNEVLPANNDFSRLLRLPETSLFAELKAWVLPAAKVKMTLSWPPLVVEHCTGGLSSQSLGHQRWEQLDRAVPALQRPAPLETMRRMPAAREPRQVDWTRMADRGCHFLRKAISDAIDVYRMAEEPTLRLERDALQARLTSSRENDIYFRPLRIESAAESEECLGSRIHDWFLQHCPGEPLPRDRKPRYLRAGTLLDYVFALGLKVDWSDIWDLLPEQITAGMVQEKLYAVIRARPEAYGMAKRLFSFLGLGTLAMPPDVAGAQRQTRIKGQILTGTEYHATLQQLHDAAGGRGVHWLATVLMFRCGLRPRELVALEVGHLTVVGDIVELKVEATPYVALKTRYSRRVVPLHALLAPGELAELLKWRAARIRECHEHVRNVRLLFGTTYHPSDYEYLFDPIEDALRRASGDTVPTERERKTAAYVFSRCSILRHSFVSYALASLLFPRDADGFQLPRGITPDLVSLQRRHRLERALLAEGHLGLSSVEALRQLTGHKSFRRTLGTYTHLMDLVSGLYAWRKSSEPALPADVVSKLTGGASRPEALIRTASARNALEHEAIGKAVDTLRAGGQVLTALPARSRRPRGKTVPPWTPTGNAFLSQIRESPEIHAGEASQELPEWHSDDLTDWRTCDLVVQMASRGIPARLIADEVGVRREVIKRLTGRYHQLLSLRRRSTATSQGQLRQAILLEGGDNLLNSFNAEDGCWYGPVKRLPSGRHDQIDVIWRQLMRQRAKPDALAYLRGFLARHRDGRIQVGDRGKKGLCEIRDWLNAVLRGAVPLFYSFRINTYPPRSSEKQAVHELTFGARREKIDRAGNAPPPKRKPGWSSDPPWTFASTLLHLMLLAEAAAPGALPEVLTRWRTARYEVPNIRNHIEKSKRKAAYKRRIIREAKEKAEAEATRLKKKAETDAAVLTSNREYHRRLESEKHARVTPLPRDPETRKPILKLVTPKPPGG